MPRLFRRAADQLASAAPDWLVETVRPAAPLRWGPMLRTAVAVTAPLVVALAAGQVVAGLLLSHGRHDRRGVRSRRVVPGQGDPDGCGPSRRAGVSPGGDGARPGLVDGAGPDGRLGGVRADQHDGVHGFGGRAPVARDGRDRRGIELPGSIGLNTLSFLLGAGWAVALMTPGWLLRPRAAEEAVVIAVYRALSRLFADRDGDALAAFDITLKNAYETVLGARSRAAGTDAERSRWSPC
ncbi:hypothetical protein ACFQX6_02410 [Streptosporangium lutulentum]